ncbi:uncharacterized protein Z519_01329 [Cladophialophora bantiana CBS 173.52]|uniref:Uncharacterized protein n=1 Tax=Cladophialophora bantiana (strain ATCC 10958 / CBS 173.52 / CDC B-1940 / NIH 8579) TaxID=1442370 RepID=A0A0D2I3F8_CLAB1|nr:uncharacterized protein Z519_01329 [Cladophialophora bantiana CBS 173.52]KIW97745.1 hypothetical protein Z519_01329 [Cladophialophora bantiana CBS 173.52]
MAIHYFKVRESELEGLHDKVALITGGSSGIGLATAKLFLNKGAQAVIVADLQRPPEGLGSRAHFVKADVASWKDLVSLFQVTMDRYGRVDIVFANAGVADVTDYVTLKEHEGQLLEPSRRPIEINLFGCQNTVALAVYHMQRQQPPGGSIVMTASGAGYEGVTSASYTSAKHGIIGFLRAMKTQLYPKIPVRLNVVAPGWTQSAITAGILDTFKSVGVPIQPASAIGLAVAKLATDPKYHGNSLFVANDQCAEFEGPILAATATCVGPSNGDEEQFQKLLMALKAHRLRQKLERRDPADLVNL